MNREDPRFPIRYEPSIHETEIVKHFSGVELTAYQATERDDNEGLDIFICFANRSGSNLFGQSLASTGEIGTFGEYFNHGTVVRLSKEWGSTTLQEYCIDLRMRMSNNNVVFCSKVGHAQLLFLNRTLVIPRIFSNPKFILVLRRDILAQAISFSIAHQTKAWTSEIEPVDGSVEFRPEDIVEKVSHISSVNNGFKSYFNILHIPYKVVYYEDLVQDPREVVSKSLSWLGLDSDAEYEPSKITLERQATWRNEEYRQRFLELYRHFRGDQQQ